MVLWYYGTMVLWCYGAMVLWCYGAMVLWYYGAMVLWYYGTMVLLDCVAAFWADNKPSRNCSSRRQTVNFTIPHFLSSVVVAAWSHFMQTHAGTPYSICCRFRHTLYVYEGWANGKPSRNCSSRRLTVHFDNRYYTFTATVRWTDSEGSAVHHEWWRCTSGVL